MLPVLSKSSIIKKTIQIGSSTLISRFLGIIREYLTARYLGAGIVSDAFITAFQIPNLFRKIFAEGALSAAFTPPFISTLRENKEKAFKLMSLAFILFEGAVLLLCAFVILIAPWIIGLFAPGFSAEKAALTVALLRILIPFIFFISSSALLAGALQAVGHFFVPAFGPILLNIVYIFGLIICMVFGLPVKYVCFFILFGGLLQFLQHLFAYFSLGFSFGLIDQKTWESFKTIIFNFLMCALGMSVMEISLIVDIRFASQLLDGTPTLIYYANRFMGIPLGVFAVAFSSILLPHFSHISRYAPKRLNFYLLESAKLVFFVTIPCMLSLLFFSQKIFSTLFLGRTFSADQVQQAGYILFAFSIGLFFFSLNKILLNIFYALRNTLAPSIIGIIATLANIGFNAAFITHLKGPGLALATTISGILQTIMMVWVLRQWYNYHSYINKFGIFVLRYTLQLTLFCGVFLIVYFNIVAFLSYYEATSVGNFFLNAIGFWIWTAPLCIITVFLIYLWRNFFGVQLYFLD